MSICLWTCNICFFLNCQQMYYHGEEIGVNVHIANSSSKTCRKIKITSKSSSRKSGPHFSKLLKTCQAQELHVPLVN